MKHKIEITTVEALIINKALRMDLGNDIDNDMAKIMIDKINRIIEKDLKKQKPTDLTNKCGSCNVNIGKAINALGGSPLKIVEHMMWQLKGLLDIKGTENNINRK